MCEALLLHIKAQRLSEEKLLQVCDLLAEQTAFSWNTNFT